MRKSAVIKLAVTMWLCTLLLTVPLVMGENGRDASTESFIVYTDKEEYLAGEAVNIYVKANAIDPNETITVTDIVVYDPANITVAEWHNISIALTDTVTPAYVGTIIAESEGVYTVSAKATGCPWILFFIWYFICKYWFGHVIPEVPFGTVVSILALIGATGLYIVRKKHPQKTTE
jgi:hypothetical protein